MIITDYLIMMDLFVKVPIVYHMDFVIPIHYIVFVILDIMANHVIVNNVLYNVPTVGNVYISMVVITAKPNVYVNLDGEVLIVKKLVVYNVKMVQNVSYPKMIMVV